MSEGIGKSALNLIDFKRQRLSEVAAGKAMGIQWRNEEDVPIDETILPVGVFPDLELEASIVEYVAARGGYDGKITAHTITSSEAAQRLATLDICLADLAMG